LTAQEALPHVRIEDQPVCRRLRQLPRAAWLHIIKQTTEAAGADKVIR
jgi:hypothetical protein